MERQSGYQLLEVDVYETNKYTCPHCNSDDTEELLGEVECLCCGYVFFTEDL